MKSHVAEISDACKVAMRSSGWERLKIKDEGHGAGSAATLVGLIYVVLPLAAKRSAKEGVTHGYP